MTELPTAKQGCSRPAKCGAGTGLVAERLDLRSGARESLGVTTVIGRRSRAQLQWIGQVFLPGKPALAALEAELFRRLGCRNVFDDEYLSTGGQLHELISGRDRFVADLRPLVLDVGGGLFCHPYDICTAMLLTEAGGVVTDPWGQSA